MNAPANIVRYATTVSHFMPGIDDETQELRCRILYLRDKSMAAQRTATWDAAQILATIVSIASVYAFAAMPFDQLQTVHKSLMRLMMAATALEVRGPGSDHNGS